VLFYFRLCNADQTSPSGETWRGMYLLFCCTRRLTHS